MNIKQIKERYTCLDYLGKPVKKVANGYLYSAPWRDDKHPSLSVTLDGKGWKDYASGEHGNLIDLVMKCLNTRDLGRVCAAFGDLLQNPSSFPQTKIFDEGKEKAASSFKTFSLVPLQSRGLYAYLVKRHINTSIAKQFLQEAHYSFQENSNGYLYALAYPNDKGGVELRNISFKGGTSPKWITTHFSIENASVIVFEGFTDMLSFATLCGSVKHNYIVLNSIVNVQAAIDVLQDYANSIYLCLDNDDAGRNTTRQMQEQLPLAKDISYRFAPCKDVNDYLCLCHSFT